MSCKLIDGSGIAECRHTFETKDCKCFASDQTDFPHEDQFCGFEQDGFVFPCDSGCCGEGCPGECLGVQPRPPDSVKTKLEIIQTEDEEIQKYLKITLGVILCLSVISTLALFKK